VPRIKLTKGERLFLVRRRRGVSQAEFARHYGVSHDTLSKVEKGRKAPSYDITVRGRINPTPPELVVVLRRRLGLSQAELAEKLGVSKQTILMREQGVGDVEYVLSVLQEVSEVE
jgi:transcriptional regulator with XRE-family HTH domain